ncbi:hypothetical protein GW17_00020059 [Ensete ventricosum]|nr:hypothetical protein GW17_00020059 [Ensete ventricosum]
MTECSMRSRGSSLSFHEQRCGRDHHPTRLKGHGWPLTDHGGITSSTSRARECACHGSRLALSLRRPCTLFMYSIMDGPLAVPRLQCQHRLTEPIIRSTTAAGSAADVGLKWQTVDRAPELCFVR